MWAAKWSHFDILKLLVDSGGDINFRDIVSDLRRKYFNLKNELLFVELNVLFS